MSKKDKSGFSQNQVKVSTGLISFSDVTSFSSNLSASKLEKKSTSKSSSSVIASINPNYSGKLTSLYCGSHSELSMQAKKFFKKDLVTRQRALNSIQPILIELVNEDDMNSIEEFIRFFLFLVPKFLFDDNWQIRDRIITILAYLLENEKVKLIFEPYFIDLLPYLFFLMSDSVKSIANKALCLLNSLFPPKKKLNIFTKFSYNILKFLLVIIELGKDALIDYTHCLEEEVHDKLERLYINAIDSLTLFISSLSFEQNMKVFEGVTNSANTFNEDIFSYKNFFQDDSLLLFTKNNDANNILKFNLSLLNLITTVCTNFNLILKQMDDSLIAFIFNCLTLDALNLNNLAIKTIISIENSYHILSKSKAISLWNKPINLLNLLTSLNDMKKKSIEIISENLLDIVVIIPIDTISIYIKKNQEVKKVNEKIESVFSTFLNDLLLIFTTNNYYLNLIQSNSFYKLKHFDKLLSDILESLLFILLRKINNDKDYEKDGKKINFFLNLLINFLSLYDLRSIYHSELISQPDLEKKSRGTNTNKKEINSSFNHLSETVSKSFNLLNQTHYNNKLYEESDKMKEFFWIPLKEKISKNFLGFFNTNACKESHIIYSSILLRQIVEVKSNDEKYNYNNITGLGFLIDQFVIFLSSLYFDELNRFDDFNSLVINLNFLNNNLLIFSGEKILLTDFFPKFNALISLSSDSWFLCLVKNFDNMKEENSLSLQSFSNLLHFLLLDKEKTNENFNRLLIILYNNHSILLLIFSLEFILSTSISLKDNEEIVSLDSLINLDEELVDNISHILNNLLLSCEDIQTIEDYNLECKEEIIRKFNQKFSLSVSLKFILILINFKEFSSIISTHLNECVTLWMSRQINERGSWLIISILYNLLNEKKYNSTYFTSKLEDCLIVIDLDSWIELEDDYDLISRFQQFFFNRDTDYENNSFLEFSSFDLKFQNSLPVTCLSSWFDIEEKLLPHFSELFQINFVNKIIEILNNKLTSTSISNPPSPSPNVMNIDKNSDLSISLTPKNWIKNCNYLNQLKSHNKIEAKISFYLLDTNFWFQLIDYLCNSKSDLAMSNSNWEYLITCMSLFLESYTPIDGLKIKNSSLLFGSDELFLTFFTCLNLLIYNSTSLLSEKVKIVARNLEDNTLSLFKDISNSDQQSILSKIQNLFSNSYKENSNISNFYFYYYKKLISILYFNSPSMNEETTQNYLTLRASKTLTISSPNPPLFNIKNESAYFILVEDHFEDEKDSKKFSLINCSIISCHTDDGIQFPYYTIQFVDNKGIKKEKQVDWSRLLLITSSNTSDLIDYSGSESEVIFSNININEADNLLSTLLTSSSSTNVDYFLHFLINLVKNLTLNFYLLDKSNKENQEFEKIIHENGIKTDKKTILLSINRDMELLQSSLPLFINYFIQFLNADTNEKDKYFYYFSSFVISPLKSILFKYFDEKIIELSNIEEEFTENDLEYTSRIKVDSYENKITTFILKENFYNQNHSSEYLDGSKLNPSLAFFNNLNKVLEVILSNISKIKEIDILCNAKNENHFLWLPILFSRLFTISFAYLNKKNSKNIHYLVNLMNSYKIFMTYINYSSVYNLFTTQLFQSLVKEFNKYNNEETSSTISTYRVSFIMLMNTFWSLQSNERASFAANTASNGENYVVSHERLTAWEMDAFSHLLDTFVTILQTYFPLVGGEFSISTSISNDIISSFSYSTLFSCFSALSSSMKLKSRNYMIKMIKHSNMKKNKDILINYFLIKNKLYLNSIILPNNFILTSLNLILTKLLDIYFSCGEEWDNEEIKLLVNESLAEVDEISEEIQEKEENIENINKEELSFDRKIFKVIYGDNLYTSLLDYFDPEIVLNRILFQDSTLTEEETKDENLDDIEENLEKETDEDFFNMTSSLKMKQKNNFKIKHNMIKYNKNYKKNAILFSLLNNSPLNSINLWIVVLQILDSVSLKFSSLRTHITSFLKDSGIFEYVISLLFLLINHNHKKNDNLNVSSILQFASFYIEGFNFNQFLSLNSALFDIHNAYNKNFNIISSSFLPNTSNNSFSASSPFITLEDLATYALFRTICILPSMIRNYWSNNCSRNEKINLSKFIEEKVRNSLLKREISLISISKSNNNWSEEQFKVKGNLVLGEIQASLLQDEVEITITISLPKNYPLKNVEVNCSSKLGIKDNNWRRWVLQMIQLLSQHDKSVIDAILLWKLNITKEMEGIEPCPICYCTIHAKSMKLPSLSCPTCKNKFHPVCISTWFKTSGKNKCVLCQQPMLNR